MKTADPYFSNTLQFHQNYPVKQGLNLSVPGLKSISDISRRPQIAQLTAQQTKFRQISTERSTLWREEQKLLIDTSRYIRPVTTITLVPKDPDTYNIILPSRKIEPAYNNWFTLFLFFTLILLTIVKHSFTKYFSSLFRSIINYPTASRLFREQNISLKQGSLIMEFFYLMVLSLFGYQLMNNFGVLLSVGNLVRFAIVLLAVTLFFLIKTFLYMIIAFINETQAETGEFLFNMKNYNKVLGVLLLPVVGLTAWAPVYNSNVFLFTGLVLMAVIYLMMLRRGVKILLKKQFSIFYLFLYLCTLEFLPLLLFLKVVS